MRQAHTFHINHPSNLSNKLLLKSQEITYISILDSNTKLSPDHLAEDYIEYDLIAGVDAIDILDSRKSSFSSLKVFHKEHKDWLFGYLSYDLKNELETLSSENWDRIGTSHLSFFIPRYVLLLKGNELIVLSHESKKKCSSFLSSLRLIEQEIFWNVKIKPRETKEEYLTKIKEIKSHIQRGDIYEMNYCQEYYAEKIDLIPSLIFNQLNKHTATPFSAFLKLKDLHVMCASPERFIKKVGNRILSQPIKGTRKREVSKVLDDEILNELKRSDKDISENLMITDLVRNDLSILAKKGSVKVEELCGVYTFEKVHQMITTISAEVDKNIYFSDILASTFPMGSMTGVPKIRAMELIEKFENFKRGLFSGAIGYITPKGDFDFNVVIRTILYNASTKYLSVGVGGAITIKSDAEEEYEECMVKVKPIFEVLNFQIDEK